MADRNPCRACGADIETDLDACPACEYNPRRALTVVGSGLFALALATALVSQEVAIVLGGVGAFILASGVVYARPTR